jgi:hypothetical protein
MAPLHPRRNRVFLIGAALFLTVFSCWMLFASYRIGFYRDDNVVEFAPLIIEGVREIKQGRIPFHSHNLGGGGGIPIIGSTYPGILNPFTLLPGILLSHEPKLMTNVIASLHLALFALGGFLLARSMKGPLWACLVAGLSLGFSGCFAVRVGIWLSVMIPFAFIPWTLLGLHWILGGTTSRKIVSGNMVTGAAVFCLFYSGSPNAAFYGGILAIIYLILLLTESTLTARRVVVRLIPQALWFVSAITPLLLMGRKFLAGHGNTEAYEVNFGNLSVPLRAYMGLFFPPITSSWKWPRIDFGMSLSGLVLSCGLVPTWFTTISFLRYPLLICNCQTLIMIGGMALFVILMSPVSLGLSGMFSNAPVLKTFFFPFRAVAAFHVLVILLFVRVTRSVPFSPSLFSRCAMIGVCLAGSLLFFQHEYLMNSLRPGTPNWFCWANEEFGDRQELKKQTLDTLRGQEGHAITLAQPQEIGSHAPYMKKPRLFLHGNLGVEYRIRTVGHYLSSAPGTAYAMIGMSFRGIMENLEAIQDFLKASLQAPPKKELEWENGILPKDVNELAQKTYVGAAIVETQWDEAVNYFENSPAWREIERNSWVTVFVRKQCLNNSTR